METQALLGKEPAIVVRYRLRRRTRVVPSRYFGMFLSADQQFKFKAAMGLKNWKHTGTFISPVGLGSQAVQTPIFKIVLSSSETDHIQDLEQLLDKPGQITSLVMQAKFAPTGSAKQDDLTVSLETSSSVNEFDAFPAEIDTVVYPATVSGHRFYEYTETAHSLLNSVVAGYTRLAFREGKKESPDTELLAEIEANRALALSLLGQAKTFSSFDQLEEVIDNFTPIARALYNSSTSLAES
jgi:hypothetical protein